MVQPVLHRLSEAEQCDEIRCLSLPRIDDCLDALSRMQYFTMLDLSSGFWQVRMDPDSVEKTAFVTHAGSFKFLVMPFGLNNAPSTFQRLMQIVLAGLTPDCCVGYMDDILVLGDTFPKHLENLEIVLERLRKANLKLKPSKCRLVRPSVSYLGYEVSAKGIATDPEKLEAVQGFPVPTDLKKL